MSADVAQREEYAGNETVDRQMGECGILTPEDLRREIAAGMFAAGSVNGATDASV